MGTVCGGLTLARFLRHLAPVLAEAQGPLTSKGLESLGVYDQPWPLPRAVSATPVAALLQRLQPDVNLGRLCSCRFWLAVYSLSPNVL